MLTFDYESTHFSNTVVLTKFIIVCRMVWDLVFISKKLKKLKEEESQPFGQTDAADFKE